MESGSAFNPEVQNASVDHKIVAALERISEVFRISLWNTGKEHGLTPIQIQVLTFLLFHPQHMRTVSYLAKELGVAKPTVSETVKALLRKSLIEKVAVPEDARSYRLQLTSEGKKKAELVSGYVSHVLPVISSVTDDEKQEFAARLMSLLAEFHGNGSVEARRMCHTCTHFQTGGGDAPHYCGLMEIPLYPADIRVDCPEHEIA